MQVLKFDPLFLSQICVERGTRTEAQVLMQFDRQYEDRGLRIALDVVT
jgi:hypothetical protein